MNNKQWYEKIPEQGVLCWVGDDKEDLSNLSIITDYMNDNYPFKTNEGCNWSFAIPLTPEEFWSLAPWNYDMDNIPIDGSILIKRKNGNIVKAFFVDGKWCIKGEIIIGYIEINQPIAWLPLPENK